MPPALPASGAARDYFVDTNLLVRLIVHDPPEMAEQVDAVFRAAAAGRLKLRLTPLVVAEAYYVLTSFYELGLADVVHALRAVLDLPGLRVEEADVLRRTLTLHAKHKKVQLIDAYLVARAEAAGHGVASFDRRVRKLDLVPVLDPHDAPPES